jgi:myo-inositol 2-dehydrogenase/D-chiro-inositol 1-dehydrogenase
MTRREALNGAAGFGILSAKTALGSQANSKISVGLLGVGGRGTYDANIVHNDPRGRITALCDKFPDRIEEGTAKLKLSNPATYTDWEKFLAAPMDAVIIATPPFEHPRMLEAAVEAKKHIYCEKPMGVDVEGCKRVIAAGRKNDPRKCISVGFQQRYGGVYVEAFNRLKAGQIGDVVNARAFWISGDPFVRKPYPDPAVEKLRNWFCYRDYSGDFIVEQDCHNFDVLYWFLDALPASAVGYWGRKVRTSMEIHDHLTLSFAWPNGIHVNFEANQISPRGFSRVGEEFTGAKGVLAVSRRQLVHIKGPNESETVEAKRDITFDAFEQFLDRIQNNNPENVAERSAYSTLIAILGRTALDTGRETTWKSLGV